jgi:hypothetical protein
MIEGLRIEMTFDELFARLTERIAHHQDGVAAFEERLLQEAHGDGADGLNPEALFQPRGCTPRQMLEVQRDEHREQVRFLELLREHLVRGEVYRLDEEDLRVADLTPETRCW